MSEDMMTNDTKVRIAMSDMVLQMDNDTFWTAWLVEFKAEKKWGIIYLKYHENKIVGKSGFKLEKIKNLTDFMDPEGAKEIPEYSWELVEYELEEYGVLKGVEPILPPYQLMDKMEIRFENSYDIDFIGWFNLKALINSKILNKAEYANTVTTTQERLPNSGIVIGNYKNMLDLFNKKFKRNEQMSLWE